MFTERHIYSLTSSTKDLRCNDFILKGPDEALYNGYYVDSNRGFKNQRTELEKQSPPPSQQVAPGCKPLNRK